MRTFCPLFFTSIFFAGLALGAQEGGAQPSAVQPSPAQPNIRNAVTDSSTILITLGTRSGPRPTIERAQSSNMLIVNGTAYLVDAGIGTTRRVTQAGLAIAAHHSGSRFREDGDGPVAAREIDPTRSDTSPQESRQPDFLAFSEDSESLRQIESGAAKPRIVLAPQQRDGGREAVSTMDSCDTR